MVVLKWQAILLGGGLLGLCGVAFGGCGDPTAAIGFILAVAGAVLVATMASRGKAAEPRPDASGAADG